MGLTTAAVVLLISLYQIVLTTGFCRFSDGTIASTGCGGCVLEDPRVLSVCSISGRWVRKRCNSGLRCAFRGGSCSAHCDLVTSTINIVSTRNSDSSTGPSGGRDCQFGNGKSATPGCSGCVATDPHMISICESSGRWLKKRCPNEGRCVFSGVSCSAKCDTGNEGPKCRFSDGKSANPGCSGCVQGNATALSTCQSNGRWLKTKCAEGTVCAFKRGSCTAKCDFLNNTESTTAPVLCKFANGKTANPGCAGCVRGDPKMISVCQPDGKWLKSRCNDTFNCDFTGGSCSASCKIPTTSDLSSTPTTSTTTTTSATTESYSTSTTHSSTIPNYVEEPGDVEVNVIDAFSV